MHVVIIFLLLLFGSSAFATDYAATVTSLSGEVSAQLGDSASRTLKLNDKVYSQEIISTSKGSKVSLLFTDETKFDLAENTVFDIRQYSYTQQTERDSFSSRILKGTFRFITGLIAKNEPASMEVHLPVATIGIRGTHVVAEARATYAKVILLEPEQPKATAVEVYNQFGSVVVDRPGYGTEVPDEFSPPSPVRRMQLRTVDNLVRSIQNSQRIRVPRPR